MNTRLLKNLQVPALVVLTALFSGCQKKDDTAAPPAAAPAGASAPAMAPAASHGMAGLKSAEKNSFDQVTAKLDPGGSFYLYLSTEQFLSGLAQKIASYSNTIAGAPGMGDDDRRNVGRIFQVVNDVITGSGVQHVSGVGFSSVARAPGLYYNKAVIHHYENESDGLIWNDFGKTAHPLKELDLLPTSTVAAAYGDTDFPQLWKSLLAEITSLHIPEADKSIAEMPAQFKAGTGMNLDDAINSLGVGYGLILTMDESNHITLPIPNAPLEIPAPGLALYFKVKDDAIYTRIEQVTAGNPMAAKSEEGGVKMITFTIPFLTLFQLQPTIARSGDYLFITTSDKLLHEMLDVQAGKKTGFKSTDEFKKLAQGVPTEGNHFTLVTERFSTILRDSMQKVMSEVQAKGADDPGKMFRDMMAANPPAFSYSVGANGPEGWVGTGNGSQSMGTVVMLVPAIAVGGLLAAIAIPNFVKARSTSQANVCISNLRIIEGAKGQWALEYHKQNTDTPTPADITPYMGPGAAGEFPVCPNGGTYIIGTMGEMPRCTIPGHTLR